MSCCCCGMFSCCDSDNEMVNNQLENERRVDRGEVGEVKLLLLGTGESGKSTFIKQMRIIHGNGFEENDKKQYIPYICHNILVSMQSMIHAMANLDIKLQNPENENNAKFIKEIVVHSVTKLNINYETILESLWTDPGIQECFMRSREYQLADSTKYFFTNLKRICGENYIPNEQDILRARVGTTVVKDYSFQIDKNRFKIIDVGGQQSLRKFWVSSVDDVTCVIYLAAISEYDQHLYENPTKNRLQESVDLFKVLINNDLMKRSSFILFLNKNDLFEEKIMNSDLADFFPNYIGPAKNAAEAKKFILQMFLDAIPKDSESSKTVYSYYTCATDTNSMKIIFETVKNTIIKCRVVQLRGS